MDWHDYWQVPNQSTHKRDSTNHDFQKETHICVTALEVFLASPYQQMCRTFRPSVNALPVRGSSNFTWPEHDWTQLGLCEADQTVAKCIQCIDW